MRRADDRSVSQLMIQTARSRRGWNRRPLPTSHARFQIDGEVYQFQFLCEQDLDTSLLGTVPVSTPCESASLWIDLHLPARSVKRLAGRRCPSTLDCFLRSRHIFPVCVVLGDLAVHYEWGTTGGPQLIFITSPDDLCCDTAQVRIRASTATGAASREASYKW